MSETYDEMLDIPADDVAMEGGGELEYAGFWSRVAALIVDNAILTIIGLALAIAAASVGAGAVVIANLALILIAILYWPLMESSQRQATIGKQLLGIKVTDTDGARLTFVRSLLRNIAKILSSLPFGLGFLLAGFTARKQALHDLITRCLVVRAGPSHFVKAVVATVGALLISIWGGYYYFKEVYLPQVAQEMARQVEKAKKEARKAAPAARPAPAQPPVAQAPTPAPVPAAKPEFEKPMPGEPKLTKSLQIAAFETKMEQPTSEPARVAAATPPAPAPASVPAPSTPAAVVMSPSPAQPAAAPFVTEAKPKSAAARAARAKREPKPAAEASALVSDPSAPSAAQPRPEEPAAVVAAPARTWSRWPKFNDVMTAVMYLDVAAAAELLELGWWVDRPDSNRLTPLMAAAWIGDLKMTQVLLKGGADPKERAPGGTVLDYAGRGGNVEVIELLKKNGAR